VLSAVEASGSITIQLVVVVLAGGAVWIKSRGRTTWRRQTDPRRHPARTARFAGAAAAVVAGAVLVTGMAATTKPRPPVPQADLVRVLDPMSGQAAATFVLYNSVPGLRERPAPLSYSGASY
jgi:hypothetical protein